MKRTLLKDAGREQQETGVKEAILKQKMRDRQIPKLTEYLH